MIFLSVPNCVLTAASESLVSRSLLFLPGPEEDIPRKMDFMDFVCHAPSNYFHARNTPYPVLHKDQDLCFVWTSLGPEIRATPSLDEIFGVKDEGEEAAVSSDISFSSKSSKEKEKEGREKEKNRDKEDRKIVKMEID